MSMNRINGVAVHAGLPDAPLQAAHQGWAGLPITLERLPAQDEVRGIAFCEPLLAVACSGSGKRWFTSGHRTSQLFTAPGMIELSGRGHEIDRARMDGAAGEVIMIPLPACVVNRFLQDVEQPLDVQTRHEVFDGQLAELAYALWDQAANGSPLGPLYVQGLTLALLGLLNTRYSTRPASSPRRIGKFRPRDRERLLALIDELPGGMCIERLAESVSIGPDHFAKMFKATFGQSPHAFVLERRIEAASRRLRAEPERPVADIASEFGFSSQAHFTKAFRRRIGTTPARWRADT
jgi:AraC family transcriptional regulator